MYGEPITIYLELVGDSEGNGMVIFDPGSESFPFMYDSVVRGGYEDYIGCIV